MKLRGRHFAAIVAATLALPQAKSQPFPVEETETERYIVEVLVFRHTDAPAEIGEPGAVPATAGDHGQPEVDSVAAEPEPELIYEPLPAEEFMLAAVEERMAASSEYEPLLHVGWIQESFPVAHAPVFRVDETYAGRPDLAGSIKFSRGRYPHLELNLDYRPEALAYEHPGWEGYQLREYRRMRDEEDHYFDNAHFGAIARVTPWEPEDRSAEDGAAVVQEPVSEPR